VSGGSNCGGSHVILAHSKQASTGLHYSRIAKPSTGCISLSQTIHSPPTSADNDVIDLAADVTTSGCVFCRDVSGGVGDLILDVVSRGK
jgi:hypothetical protein